MQWTKEKFMEILLMVYKRIYNIFRSTFQIAPVQEARFVFSADLMADRCTYCGKFCGN